MSESWWLRTRFHNRDRNLRQMQREMKGEGRARYTTAKDSDIDDTVRVIHGFSLFPADHPDEGRIIKEGLPEAMPVLLDPFR